MEARLSEQAMEIVRTRDSGTLQYEIFFNEDESEAVVFERYRIAAGAGDIHSSLSARRRNSSGTERTPCIADP